MSNSERMCIRNLAARRVRALRRCLPSRRTRGRREDRMRAAPAVSCAKRAQKHAHEHTGPAEAIRLSLRNGFNGLYAISPVSGLFSHRPPGALDPEVDSSVGESGPHDFAVRACIARLATPARPPHPAPTSVAIGQTPLSGRIRMRVEWHIFLKNGREIFR